MLAGALLLSPVSDAHLSATSKTRAHRAVTRVIARTASPGAEVAVIRHGRFIWSEAAGVLGVGGQHATRPHDRFVIASATKPIIATLTMHLVEQGEIALTDTVSSFGINVPNGDRITIRMLLEHRSGLPEYFTDPFVNLNLLNPAHPWTREEVIDAIARGRPNFEPDARFEYCNSGYIVLGEILERESGLSIETLLRRVLDKPLGLPTLSFQTEVPGSAIAHGHSSASGEVVDRYERAGGRVPSDVIGPVWTDGGIASDAKDLARLTDSLFAGKVLERSTVRRMAPVKTGTYGLGLYRRDSVGGGTELGHEGVYGGYTAYVARDQRTGTTVAAVANTDTPEDTATELADAVRASITRHHSPG
jgi:D-alanyl-D-alanine carboxypeptidase